MEEQPDFQTYSKNYKKKVRTCQSHHWNVNIYTGQSSGLPYMELSRADIKAWKALGRDCTNNNGLILQIGVLSS